MNEETVSFGDNSSPRKSRKRKQVDNPQLRSHSADHDHTYSKNKCTHRDTSLRKNRKTLQNDNTECPYESIEVDDNQCLSTNFLLPQQNGLPQICIEGNQYSVRNVPGDGDCLFHCLSLALYENISHARFHRHLIANVVASKWDNFKHMAEECHGKTFLSANDYLYHMLVDKAWVTACEINAATAIFKRNVSTFLQGSRSNGLLHPDEVTYNEVNYQCQENRNAQTIRLLLSHNHFQLLEVNNATSAIGSFNDTYVEVSPSKKNTEVPSNTNRKAAEKLTNTSTTESFRNGQQIQDTHLTSQNDLQQKYAYQNNTHSNFYLPEEADTYLKCRKLGIRFQSPENNENAQEKTLRKKRNTSNIRYKEKKINLKADSLPDPPPLSENEQLNKAMDTIRTFEIEQMSYAFKLCLQRAATEYASFKRCL